MRCNEAMQSMQRDIDADLSDDERFEMNGHLDLCEDCERFYRSLKELSINLESLPDVKPPVSLVDQILPQIVREDTFIKHRKRKERLKKWSLVAGGLAAAMFVWMLSDRSFTSEISDLAERAQKNTVQDGEIGTERSDMFAMNQKGDKFHRDSNLPSLEHEGDDSISTQKPTPPQNEIGLGEGVQRSLNTNKEEPRSVEEVDRQGTSEEQRQKQKPKTETKIERETELASKDDKPYKKTTSAEEDQKTSESELASAPAAENDITPRMMMAPPISKKDDKIELNKQSSVSIGATNLVIKDQSGQEVFSSHEWKEKADVSYRWINSNRLEYLVELKKSDSEDEEPITKETWIVDLKKKQEYKRSD